MSNGIYNNLLFAIAVSENASLISQRSMSYGFRLIFFSALRQALVGAILKS